MPASEVPGYTMDRSMRIRINDYVAPNAWVFLTSPVPAETGRRLGTGLPREARPCLTSERRDFGHDR